MAGFLPPITRQKFIMYAIDHIDPRWEEGRDYQLVCGQDWECNKVLRANSFNVSKSNRFLPWRVTQGEIGAVPIEQGDLCLFLDPETSEWVLEEFLGEWWYQKTRSLCGGSRAGKSGQNRDAQRFKNIGRLGGKAGKGRKMRVLKKQQIRYFSAL